MSLPEELRRLYKQGGGWRDLFDALSVYRKPMPSLSLVRAIEISGLAHETVLSGMKDLAALKVADFKLGRRGGKTRLEWHFSPGSVGRVAQGKQDELEAYAEADERSDDNGTSTPRELPAASLNAPLSPSRIVEQAKTALASQLGIEVDQIEIIIRY